MALAGWIMVMACLVCPGVVWAQSARDLVTEGNELYSAGEFGRAIESYDKAGAEAPDAAEIWFNKGDAYFRMGEYDKARDAYQRAATLTKDLELEARSHHNLGLTSFEEARKEKDGADLKKILSHYEESVRHYRDALRIDPNLQQSARNMEVTRLIMKDLMDQIRKQEEAARQNKEQREQLMKDLQENIQEQASEAGASEALEKKMSEEKDQFLRQESTKLAGEQARTSEKTSDIAERLKSMMDQGGQQPASPQASPSPQPQPDQSSPAESLEKAMNAQKSAIDKLEEHEPGEAAEHQKEALKELKEAQARLSKPPEGGGQCKTDNKQEKQDQQEEQSSKEQSEDSQSEQKQAQQAQSGNEQKQDNTSKSGQQAEAEQGKDQQSARKSMEKPDEKSGEEALEAIGSLPEDIFREERENRMMQERARAGAHRPSEKDW